MAKKVELTYPELMAANDALERLGSMAVSRKLAYAIAKNKRLLGYEIADLQAALKFPAESSERFRKYNQYRMTLAKERARKDDQGQPISTNGQWEIIDKLGFEAELERWLKANDPELLTQIEEHDAKVRELLDGRFTVEVFEMKISMFPETFEPGRLGPVVDWLIDDEVE